LNLSISALDYQTSIKNGDFTVEEFISKSIEKINSVEDRPSCIFVEDE